MYKKSKNILAGLLIVAISLISLNSPGISAASNNYNIIMYLNSYRAVITEQLTDIDKDNSEVYPVRKDGTILLPLRFVAEHLNATVELEPGSNEVKVNFQDVITLLSIGSTKVEINNKEFKLKAPIQVINNRTFVPIKVVEEVFNKEVLYYNGLIVIGDNKNSFNSNFCNELINKLKRYQQETNPLFPILINGKWGYIDKFGKIKIEPKYDRVTTFSEGLALVEMGNKSQFIDKHGKLSFSMSNSSSYYTPGFSEGIAGVWELGWGYDYCSFYDKKGNIIGKEDVGSLIFSDLYIGAEYEFRDHRARTNTYFSGELVPVRIDYGLEAGYYSYMNKKGEFPIKYKFYEAQNFSEGLAAVTGRYEIDDKATEEAQYPHDLFREYTGDLNKSGFINNKGEFVIPLNNDFIFALSFSEGLAAIKFSNSEWGFIDKSGKTVIEPKFISAESFNDGLALVLENDKYGYIDYAGKYVIEPTYTSACSFSEGLAAVKKGDFWGFINKRGEVVIDFIYDDVEAFHNGLAKVYGIDRKYIDYWRADYNKYEHFAYINKQNNVIWKTPVSN